MNYLDISGIVNILRDVIQDRWKNPNLYPIFRINEKIYIDRNYFYNDVTEDPEDKATKLYGYFGGKGSTGSDLITYKKYIKYNWMDNIPKYDKYLLEIVQVKLNDYLLKGGDTKDVTPGQYEITIFTSESYNPTKKIDEYTYILNFPRV